MTATTIQTPIAAVLIAVDDKDAQEFTLEHSDLNGVLCITLDGTRALEPDQLVGIWTATNAARHDDRYGNFIKGLYSHAVYDARPRAQGLDLGHELHHAGKVAAARAHEILSEQRPNDPARGTKNGCYHPDITQ